MAAPAMKAGGGGGDKKHHQVGSRFLSVAACCFLLSVAFTLSSRYNATLVLSTRNRRGDFRPSQGGSHGGGDGELKQLAQQSHDRDAAAADDDDATSNSDEQAKPAAEDADPDHDKLLTAAAGTTAQPVVQVQATAMSPQREHPGDTHAAAALANQQRQPLCDLSGSRSDVCALTGDIRLDANASAFIVVVDPTATAAAANVPTTSYKVRPYPRKGDATSMGRVTELTVRTTTTDAGEAALPRCTATHAEPAVVFSISGYAGNIFHDFTDVIVPLYGAAQRYRGDVRLVVADAARGGSWRWLAKYAAVLRGLSRHPLLDLAAAAKAGEVHCFRHVVVGLRAHREFMIEPESSGPDGGGMVDFARFLRRALSLPRDAPTTRQSSRKPRLLIIARRGTRRLLNADAVARVAGEVGFEAVVSDLDAAGSNGDVAAVGRLINSFDAVVGVHGAGLTNMVFLPPGAALVQIVPWGGLRWIARLDFGDPAEAMGLRYVQYEIAVHESSLRDKYPRDHEVFTNPTALHRKGFTFLRHTFLIGQDVTIDVDRFRVALLQAFQNLTK